VTHGYDGLKVAPGNEEELAKAIISVLTEDGLAAKLIKNACQEVNSVYNWEHIARSTIAVYQDAALIDKTHKEVG
jgi:glycosyltransferase involved in cell wall biosynthesis